MELVEAAEREKSVPTVVRPEAAWHEHIITMLTGVWITLGMALDAAAHANFSEIESFFTPWHAVLYTGFFASVVWTLTLVARHGRGRRRGVLAAIPRGHEIGLAGLLLFALSGLADMIWHIYFGFEKGSQALISPSHAGLFLGTMLILSTPFRVAWSKPDGRDVSLKAFLPTLLSLIFTVLVLTFVFQWLWPFYHDQHRWRVWFAWLLRDVALPATPIGTALSELTMRSGISHILLANLLIVGPILLILRRWHPPFGSMTVFLTMTIGPGAYYELIPASLLAGLAADGLVQALRPSPERLWAVRVFAFFLPLLVWGLYFKAILARWALPWSPTVYVGVMAWTAISALGLSVIMLPAPVPVSSKAA